MRFLLLALLFPTLTWAQSSVKEVPLIPRATLFNAELINDVKMAREGDRIFYRKTGDSKNVFTRGIENPEEELKWEFSNPIYEWAVGADNMMIAITNQDSCDGIEMITFKIPGVDGTTISRSVGTPPGTQFSIVKTGTERAMSLLLKMTDPKTETITYLDFDAASRDVYRPIIGGENMDKMFFDSEYQPRAAQRLTEDGNKQMFFRNEEEVWENFQETQWDESEFLGGFNSIISVDDDGVVYYTSNESRDKAELRSFDPKTRLATTLAADSFADIVPFVATISSSGKPEAVVALFDKTRRHFTNDKAAVDFTWLRVQHPGDVGFVDSSGDDKQWLIRYLSGESYDYFIYKREEKTLTKILTACEAIEAYETTPRTGFQVPTRDGKLLPIQVYLPPGSDENGDGIPDKPLPTIMYVHGGPWVGVVHWNGWYHVRNFMLLANRGYAVINCEFRASTGMGKKMLNAGDYEWGNDMHFDLMDIRQWAVDQGVAADDKVAMWGWSYGGYAANFALGKVPDAFACGISMYGIADLLEFRKSKYTHTSSLWNRRVGDISTEAGMDTIISHSPYTYMENITSPLLLTHGTLDARVDQSQSDNFADALDKLDKDVVYFYYPEEPHDYVTPEAWSSFWAISEQFLSEHLGGRYEPVGEDVRNGNFVVNYGAKWIKHLD